MMATASFHARIARINQANNKGLSHRHPVAAMAARAPQQAYARERLGSGRTFQLSGLFLPVGLGLVLGFLASLLLTAVTSSGSVIGPGMPYNHELFLVAMAFLGLSPLFMLVALIQQGRNPRFALFALAYLSGLVLTLLV